MLHPNPLIAFKRLLRLYGGATIAVTVAPLLHRSAWFAVPALAGVALMLTTIVPMYLESGRMLDRAEAQAEDADPRLTNDH